MFKMFSTVNFIKIVCAMISLSRIQQTLDNLESKHKEKSSILKRSIINPIFGFLFDSTGLLNNLRFYSSEVKISEISKDRQYKNDTSGNSFIELLIKLFPSPDGILSISLESKDSFAYKFNQSRSENIKFISEIFVEILISEKQSDKAQANEDLNTIRNLFISEASIVGFDNIKILKLMAIHFFVISLLETQDEFEKYLENILVNIKNQNSIEIYEINQEIFSEISKIDKEFNSFPYSTFKYPPSNEMIPIFDRNKKDENAFLENKPFPDCADVLLLNICNCLLFNPNTMTYYTENLNKELDIYKFYTKFNTLFSITKNIRKEWSRVVQGLDDFPETSKQNIYNTHLIVYKREKRNEIKSGLINMMNVLIKIFDIDHAKFWKKFSGKKSLIKKINDLFEKISPDIEGRKISISVDEDTISEFNSMNRKDFTGIFNIEVKLPGGRNIILAVQHFGYHAEMRLISSNNQNFDNEKLKNLTNNLPNKMPFSLIKKFIEISSDIPKKSLNFAENIFCSAKIETDHQKIKNLKLLFEYLTDEAFVFENKEKEETDKSIRNIIINILSTIPLNDPSTKLKFLPFMVYIEDLSESDVVKGLEMSIAIGNLAIDKLWAKRINEMKIREITIDFASIFKKQLPKLFEILKNLSYKYDVKFTNMPENAQRIILENLSKLQNISGLDISKNKMDMESCELLANSLQKMLNLEKLNLSELFIDSNQDEEDDFVSFNDMDNNPSKLNVILSALCKLTNMKTLNISKNNFDSSNIRGLASTLEQMNSLIHLDLSNIELPADKDTISLLFNSIERLSNLIFLNFSNSNIGSFLKILHSLKNLKELRLAEIEINIENSKILNENLKNHENLETIDFSHNNLGQAKSVLILEGIQNSKNLKNLIFSNNNLQVEGARAIVESLTYFENLTRIDLGGNFIKAEGLNGILKLKNLNNLTELNLSRNDLKKEGTILLADNLKNFKNLKKLYLSNNDIDSVGANTLFESLKDMENIEVLDLNMNCIDKNSIDSILNFLNEPQKLKEIHLNKNKFSNAEVQSILSKLNLERFTIHLDIDQENLSDQD